MAGEADKRHTRAPLSLRGQPRRRLRLRPCPPTPRPPRSSILAATHSLPLLAVVPDSLRPTTTQSFELHTLDAADTLAMLSKPLQIWSAVALLAVSASAQFPSNNTACTRHYVVQDGDTCDKIGQKTLTSTYQIMSLNLPDAGPDCYTLEIGVVSAGMEREGGGIRLTERHRLHTAPLPGDVRQ